MRSAIANRCEDGGGWQPVASNDMNTHHLIAQSISRRPHAMAREVLRGIFQLAHFNFDLLEALYGRAPGAIRLARPHLAFEGK